MDARLVLWDIPNARMLWTVDSDQGWVHAVVFSPDGSLASSGGNGDRHDDLKFWDVKTGQCIRTLAAHAAGTYVLAFSPDGKLLLSGGTDNTAKLWEVATGRLVRTLADAEGASVAFSPDGKILYSRGPSVRSWDAASGKLLRAAPVPAAPSEQGPPHYAFSADGKVGVRALRWGMLLQWDTVSGRILRTFERKGVPEEVWALAVSPDSKTILSAGAAGTLALWDAASGNVVRTIRNAPTGQRPGIK
jgi:WD40 repeat protein